MIQIRIHQCLTIHTVTFEEKHWVVIVLIRLPSKYVPYILWIHPKYIHPMKLKRKMYYILDLCLIANAAKSTWKLVVPAKRASDAKSAFYVALAKKETFVSSRVWLPLQYYQERTKVASTTTTSCYCITPVPSFLIPPTSVAFQIQLREEEIQICTLLNVFFLGWIKIHI